MSENAYQTCGGCGATHPDQRCIGCLHYFGSGSWDTRTILGEQPSVASEDVEWLQELEIHEAYWLPHDHPEHPSNLSKAKAKEGAK